MSADDHHDIRMSLGDHLDELRRRLWLGLIGPVAASVVAMVFGRTIVAWLAQPVLYELYANDLASTLYATKPQATLTVYFKVSFITGLIAGIPWLLYQAWLFIAPGLYRHERRFVVSLLPGSALLSALGVAFMYYVILPVTLSFMVFWTLTYPMPELQGSWVQNQIREARQVEPGLESDGNQPTLAPLRQADPASPPDGAFWINVPQRAFKYVVDGEVRQLHGTRTARMAAPWFTIDEYINFALWLGLATALAFQLPLVMLLLGWTGLVDRRQFAQWRGYAVLACVVVAAIITPPDPTSQIALALPMYALYEVGLILMRLLIKPRPLRFDDDAEA